jgi:hypothetical protein
LFGSFRNQALFDPLVRHARAQVGRGRPLLQALLVQGAGEAVVARDPVGGHDDPGDIPPVGRWRLVSREAWWWWRWWWLLGRSGIAIRVVRGRVVIPFRGRDVSCRAAFPGGRRGEVGLVPPRHARRASLASLLQPGTSSRRCRSRRVGIVACWTVQGLIDAVLAVGLAIGTCRLFVVAFDLMGTCKLRRNSNFASRHVYERRGLYQSPCAVDRRNTPQRPVSWDARMP